MAQETATHWRQKKKIICNTLDEKKKTFYAITYIYVVIPRRYLGGEKLWDSCWNVSEGKNMRIVSCAKIYASSSTDHLYSPVQENFLTVAKSLLNNRPKHTGWMLQNFGSCVIISCWYSKVITLVLLSPQNFACLCVVFTDWRKKHNNDTGIHFNDMNSYNILGILSGIWRTETYDTQTWIEKKPGTRRTWRSYVRNFSVTLKM